MLTVKQICNSGHENVIEAKRISYQPKQADDGPPETVFIEGPDGNICPHVSGKIFVMNDAGQTVARYFLNPAD